MFLNRRNHDNLSNGSKINTNRSALPEIDFAQNRFLGNIIGAPVDPDQWDDDFGEAEGGVGNSEDGVAATLCPVVSHLES